MFDIYAMRCTLSFTISEEYLGSVTWELLISELANALDVYDDEHDYRETGEPLYDIHFDIVNPTDGTLPAEINTAELKIAAIFKEYGVPLDCIVDFKPDLTAK